MTHIVHDRESAAKFLGLKKFRIEGKLKGPNFPHDSGRDISFAIYAKNKKAVEKRMKSYNWIFWKGEEL